MNQTDGITHTMLVHHIVERAVSTTFDHFGDVFRIGAETCHEVVDGDVLLREDMFLGKYPEMGSLMGASTQKYRCLSTENR